MSTHNNHPVLPQTPTEDPEERYDPEPRRDWVRAAITLSLIFALLVICGERFLIDSVSERLATHRSKKGDYDPEQPVAAGHWGQQRS
jgi:hypothetical protein